MDPPSPPTAQQMPSWTFAASSTTNACTSLSFHEFIAWFAPSPSHQHEFVFPTSSVPRIAFKQPLPHEGFSTDKVWYRMGLPLFVYSPPHVLCCLGHTMHMDLHGTLSPNAGKVMRPPGHHALTCLCIQTTHQSLQWSRKQYSPWDLYPAFIHFFTVSLTTDTGGWSPEQTNSIRLRRFTSSSILPIF